MWTEFVGSLLCSERFLSGNSAAFPLSSKTNIWYDLFALFDLQSPQLVEAEHSRSARMIWD